MADFSIDSISFAESIFGTNTNNWVNISHPKFLFFAKFITTDNTDTRPVTVAIKSVDRPKFSFQTQHLNQYNKRRIVQTHLEHGEIRMVIHDIVDHRIHDFFQKYWEYYFYQGQYSHDASNKSKWAYDISLNDFKGPMGYKVQTNGNDAFLDSIQIYSLYGGKYNRWDLVNPKIKDYSPDGYDHHAMVETNEISLTIDYEGVLFSKVNERLEPGADSQSGPGGGILTESGMDLADKDINLADDGNWGQNLQLPTADSNVTALSSIRAKQEASYKPASISNIRTRYQPEDKPEIIKQVQKISSKTPKKIIPKQAAPQSVSDGMAFQAAEPNMIYSSASSSAPITNPYTTETDIGPVTFGKIPSGNVTKAKNLSGSTLDIMTGKIGGSAYAKTLATSLLYYPNTGQSIIKTKNGISFSDTALGILNVSKNSGVQLGHKLTPSPSSSVGVIDWTNL